MWTIHYFVDIASICLNMDVIVTHQTPLMCNKAKQKQEVQNRKLKETKSTTMNIFHFFYFVFKSLVKVELSYVFTINLLTIAENCTEK